MDDTIIQLASSKDSEEKLVNTVRQLTDTEIYSLMKKTNKLVNFVRALFDGMPIENRRTARRARILAKLIEMVHLQQLEPKIGKSVINFVIDELDYLSGKSLTKIANFLTDKAYTGTEGNYSSAVLDVFPKCLALINGFEEIVITNDVKKPGTEIKRDFVEKLCQLDWGIQSVVHYVTMFRDVPLEESEFKMVVKKILKEIKKIGIQEIPPLIYQLLLLSTKGLKDMILKGIIDYFSYIERQNEKSINRDTLLRVEGTVLLHINFAVKQDQELGKTFIKVMKQEMQINCFALAVLLTIAKLQSFASAVNTFLKKKVDENFLELSQKLVVKSDAKELSVVEPLGHLLLDVVKRSVFGWDCVIQGLVQLGTFLLDSKSSIRTDAAFTNSTTPLTCNDLGLQILQQLFLSHKDVRNEILEQIFNRIVTKATNTNKYIQLLEQIVMQQSGSLTDHISKFKEIVEYLSFQTPEVATGLLKAVNQLFKHATDFQDYVILILRKSMYSREADARLVALNGFLQLLKSSSQGQQSTSMSQRQASSVDLELLGFLRRCLSQQSSVRARLYEGFAEVVDIKEHLADTIVSILSTHMIKFCDPDAKSGPLRLESCVDPNSCTVVEPLGHLLYYLQKCTTKNSRSKENSTLHAAKGKIKKLADRIINSELEEHELDKSTEFASSTEEGRVNQLKASVALGVFASVMDYVLLLKEGSNSEKLEDLAKIFKLYSELLSLVKDKEKAGNKEGKRGKKNAKAFDPESYVPPLGIQFTKKLLSLVHFAQDENDQEEEKDEVHDLPNNVKFLCFMHQIAKRQLQKMKQENKQQQGYVKMHFNLIAELGHLFLREASRYISKGSDIIGDSKTSKKTKNPLLLTSENFLDCFELVCSTNSEEHVSKFFDDVIKGDHNAQTSGEKISAYMSLLEDLINELLESKIWSKEIECYIQIDVTLGSMCPLEFIDSHVKWINEICAKTSEFKDVSLAKTLVSCCITFNCYAGNLKKLEELAIDVFKEAGHIQGHQNGEISLKNAIVTSDTKDIVATCIIAGVEKLLEDALWKYKTILALSAKEQSPEVSKNELNQLIKSREQKEKLFYSRIEAIATILSPITSAALQRSASEALIGVVTKCYKALITVTKHMIDVVKFQKSNSQKIQVSKYFGKVSDFFAKKVTENIYPFINYHSNLVKTKVKVGKDAKAIPNLIFQIEQYERFLLTLSNISKINFMKNMKRSPARDLKIAQGEEEEEVEKPKKTKRGRKRKKDDEEENEEENGEENEEEEQSQPKKKRKSPKKKGESKKRKSPKKKD